MQKKYSKRNVALIIAIIVVIGFIIISPSFRREPIPNVPSNYSFGALAPIISLNQTALVVDNSTTVQKIYLGQKPLLRIENMDVSGCGNARIFLIRNVSSESDDGEYSAIDLGPVAYSKGHTNYQLPYNINASQYNAVSVWCDSTDMQIGSAIFQ